MALVGAEVDNKTLESAGWGIINRANKLRNEGKEKYAEKLRTLGRQMVEEARKDDNHPSTQLPSQSEFEQALEGEEENEFEDSLFKVEG